MKHSNSFWLACTVTAPKTMEGSDPTGLGMVNPPEARSHKYSS